MSKWTAKNTIKRRKIGLVELSREDKVILNGTPVDIEETRFFSIGCLRKVNYKALEKMQETYKNHRCILEIDRSFITSS